MKPKLISATFEVIHDGVAYIVQFGQASVTVQNSRWRATLRQAYPPTLLSCQKLIDKFVAQRQSISNRGLTVYREEPAVDA